MRIINNSINNTNTVDYQESARGHAGDHRAVAGGTTGGVASETGQHRSPQAAHSGDEQRQPQQGQSPRPQTIMDRREEQTRVTRFHDEPRHVSMNICRGGICVSPSHQCAMPNCTAEKVPKNDAMSMHRKCHNDSQDQTTYPTEDDAIESKKSNDMQVPVDISDAST